MRKVLSLSATLGLFSTSMFWNGEAISVYANVPSLYIIAAVVGGGVLWSFSLDRLNEALWLSFGTGPLKQEEAERVHGVFDRLADLAVGAGLLGVLIGLIRMLLSMDDPTTIGPAMAVALLSLFYSILLAEVSFRAIAADVMARARPSATSSSHEGEFDGRKVGATVIMAAFLLGGILIGGPLHSFINVPSIILVLGFIGAGIFASFSTREVLLAVGMVWGTNPLEEDEALVGFHVFSRASELAIGGGVLGTIVGLVQMLQNLEDPTAIGPALAIALLTMFYGVFLSEAVFRTIGADCLARAEVTRDVGQLRGSGKLMGMIAAPFILLFVFFVLLVAMSTGF